ncbi:MAG: alpha-N-arabinofuranosidase [Cytophagales bacterium]|nr:alpha-N-arabinofuranosidase [Armatimonadota bacterium]
MASTTTVTVVMNEEMGTISPRLHGHFAEHLGRCVYDGLWVGLDSPVPNEGGWRRDAIAALKAMTVPMLRWPGGCFADSYHWRDGIGPTSRRPRTLAESCGERVVETNAVGTHEFLDLCRLIGAEPYLAGNVGSGTVQELADWVQYCNGAADTTLVRERVANGHVDPMKVRLWGIGNENWGCGGNYDAEIYAHDFRRYETFVRQTDPFVETVACGFDPKWNRVLIETLKANNKLGGMNHLSLHRYWNAGPAVGFSEEEYYHLHRGGELVEGDIIAAKQLIHEATGGRHRVGIALDEWGVWHPDANVTSQFEAVSTQRDAVATTGVFDTLHRHAADVSMANIAQIVNVLHAPLQTRGGALWMTPTGHVFALYAPHQGGQSLRLDFQNVPIRPLSALTHLNWATPTEPLRDLPLVTASASRNLVGGLVVSLTNRHHADPLAVILRFAGGEAPQGMGRMGTLAADSLDAANNAEDPHRVAVKWREIEIRSSSGVTLTLPPASVQTLHLG